MDYTLKVVRRGVDPQDERWFSQETIPILQKAHDEIEWLLNRNYKLSQVIEMVGNHYQFSSRQRNALMRSVVSDANKKIRMSSLLPLSYAKEGTINIDGFNLIITMEVALSNGILIRCSDGTIRDIAGLRGTYKIIDKTNKALNILGSFFKYFKLPHAIFFLETNVSNSGRLKSFILEHSKSWYTLTDVELVPNADVILSKMDKVITSDSIILNQCISWFNIMPKLINNYIKHANLIDLS